MEQERTEYHQDWMQFAALNFPIMRSSTPFEEGRYTYPVQFQMPVGIPGTFGHKDEAHEEAYERIQYNLYVELFAEGERIGRAWSPIVVM